MNPTTEAIVRIGCFAGVLLALTLWEYAAPRRPLTTSKSRRWSSNLSLVVINGILARILIPVTAVAAADYAHAQNWGTFSLIHWPIWLEIVLAVVIFDFAIYLQHVIFHAVPVLWRLHSAHHADLDFDVTTGVRFHTLEILISALIKLAVVVALGPPVMAVIIFEVLLNATSMFNHSNIQMPARLDRLLRWWVVTPDMHRVHHSVLRREANSNYGFNVPWWDYLLGTYRAQPQAGHHAMTIGVSTLRDEKQTSRLIGILSLPFRSEQSASSLPQHRSGTSDAKSTDAIDSNQ